MFQRSLKAAGHGSGAHGAIEGRLMVACCGLDKTGGAVRCSIHSKNQ